MDPEQEVARAIPPVIDTAADVYQGGRELWNDARNVGRTGAAAGEAAWNMAGDAVGGAGRAVENAGARAVSWGVNRGARAVQAARDAFGWIAD